MRSAPVPGDAPPPAPDGADSWLANRRFGLWVAMATAVLAIGVGLLIPSVFSPDLLTEEGMVERSTIWVYGLAVACALLLRWPGMPRRDMLAAGLLLAAMAAREADLHKALFGTSILKSRFYLDASSAAPVLTALALLLPIVLAGLWLLARHGRRWLHAPAQWNAPMVSVASMVVAMVFAKVMDRTPSTLDQLSLLKQVPLTLVYVMLGLEEILEFALPLFAIVAMLQCQLLGRRRQR